MPPRNVRTMGHQNVFFRLVQSPELETMLQLVFKALMEVTPWPLGCYYATLILFCSKTFVSEGSCFGCCNCNFSWLSGCVLCAYHNSFYCFTCYAFFFHWIFICDWNEKLEIHKAPPCLIPNESAVVDLILRSNSCSSLKFTHFTVLARQWY